MTLRTPLALRPILALSLIAGLAVLLALLYSRGQLIYGNDASLYISVANSLAAGEGLRTNVVSAERGSISPLVTVWPPGFPAAQAVFIAFGVPGVISAQLVTLIALAICVGLVAWITWAPLGPRAGLFAAFLVAMQPEFWNLATVGTSELPFLCFLLMVPFCFAANHAHARTAGLASAMTGAFYIRYSGIFLIPAVLVSFLWRGSRGPLKSSELSSAVVVALGINAALVAYNVTLSGHVSGDPRSESMKGVLRIAVDAGTGLFDLLAPLSLVLAVKSRPTMELILSAVCLVSLYVVGLWSIRSLADVRIRVTALLAMMYVPSIIVLRSITQFDDLNARLMSPVLPFIVIAITAIASLASPAYRVALTGGIAIAFVALAAANLTAGLNMSGKAAVAPAAPELRSRIPSGVRVASADAIVLAPFLPGRFIIPINEAQSPDEALALCRQAGCDYIVVLPKYQDRRGSTLAYDPLWAGSDGGTDSASQPFLIQKIEPSFDSLRHQF